MKKKLAFIISGVVAIGILGFGVLYSSTSQAEASLSTEDIKDMVNEQYPGEITEIAQETEFNRAVFEVEIKTKDREYDIKLDGKTGEILNITENPNKEKAEANNEKDQSKEEKVEGNTSEEQSKAVVIKEKKDEKSKHKQQKNKKQKSDQKKSEEKRVIISIEEAKRIALAEFSGEIDDIELDTEDGRLIYEVEIERGDKEAEIEIDAYTGEILLIEIDED